MLIYALAATMLVQSPPLQFDLVCTGNSTMIMGGRTTRSTFESHYRFDLEKALWCIGPCQTVSDIEEVTPATIVFHVVTDAGTNVFRVSRTSGTLTSVWHALPNSIPMTASSQGTCEARPYSGIPASSRF